MAKKELAAWQEKMLTDAKNVAHNEGSDSSAVTIQHGRLMYHDAEVPDNTLEVIVIATATERCYYDKPYDPDLISSPACFAQSLETQGLVPHENVKEPQAADCDSCPMAEFGSAKVGKGPACKTYRRLSMVPAGVLPEDLPKAEIAYMKVSPTSVKNWSKYATSVAAQAGVPPWAARTKITVKPDKKTMWQILFESTGLLEEEMLPGVHALIEKGEDLLMRPYTYDDEDTADSGKY